MSRRTPPDPDAPPKPEPWTKPNRFRRLLVTALDTDADGNLTGTRCVYLQSSLLPPGFMTDFNTHNDLFAVMLPVEQCVDLVKWAWSVELHVSYDPPNNLAGHFRRKRQEQPTLFDIG